MRGPDGAVASAHAQLAFTFSRAAAPFPLSFPVIFSRYLFPFPLSRPAQQRDPLPRERRQGGSAAGGGVAVPLTRAHVFGGARGAADMEQPSPSAGSQEELSESEESVYSGLEDSGSDSESSASDHEDEEEEEEDEEEEAPGSPSAPQTQAKGIPGKRKTLGDDSPLEGERELLLRDEYEQDSSDEEDIRNTVGNIPMEWYQDFPHVGYDLDGRRIFKPLRNKDELDLFLERMENPEYWRTVEDRQTGAEVRLSEEQLELVRRLQRGNFGDVNFDPYEPAVDFFSHEVRIHPVTNRPADKRSFIPSLLEKEKVSKLVHAIKMGWIQPRKPKENVPTFYDLWAREDPNSILGRHKMHVPAPKIPLPGHAESYNPPPEFLLSPEEERSWEQQEPSERRLNFIPRKFGSLRAVPAYPRFIHERFERCLDLYLCPRQRKMRVNVDPEDLIPKLPKPRDLQPFPTTQALIYRGHSSLVRTLSVSPSGQWLVSGSDDGTVRFWEVISARCLRTVAVGSAVRSVAWNPNPNICLVAAAVEDQVLLLNPALGDRLLVAATDQLLDSWEAPQEQRIQPVQWIPADPEERAKGIRLRLQHDKPVIQVTWHPKGDYWASVVRNAGGRQVLIHQSSRRWSQDPFRRSPGLIQCVQFHPLRPYFLVASQRSVRIYNLLRQELTKKLQSNCQWISSMAVHPGGDNVICGSYDSKLAWFDLDLSTRPYRLLRHHRRALRAVSFHRRYPLFASASDDGTVIVCHGMVYSDLLQNALLVPLKVLKGHVPTLDLGVLDVAFHPQQPWLFSSGADGTLRLYT